MSSDLYEAIRGRELKGRARTLADCALPLRRPFFGGKSRIAPCGYEGEHEMPPSWTTLRWKAKGGYGSQGDGRGRENAEREVAWFSPHCLEPTQQGQFAFDILDAASVE